jgi:hypothetical protein
MINLSRNSQRRKKSQNFFSRLRIWRMTLEARSSSRRMSARISPTSSRSEAGYLINQFGCLDVGQNGAKRLVDLVSDRCSELACHLITVNMSKLG